MNLKQLFNYLDSNDKALLQPLNPDTVASALTSALAQLEAEHPGIAERHGWINLNDLQAFLLNAASAASATAPEGLLSDRAREH